MKDLKDVLQTMKTADIWTWGRETQFNKGRIEIYIDDIPNDLRVVYSVTIYRDRTARSEKRHLRGYDPIKKCWSRYSLASETQHDIKAPGWKALRQYITDTCRQADAWKPNPETFTYFKPQ